MFNAPLEMVYVLMKSGDRGQKASDISNIKHRILPNGRSARWEAVQELEKIPESGEANPIIMNVTLV